MGQKKQWTRPQLIVLGRGTPEERVLETCKHPQAQQVGPYQSQGACKSNITGNCSNCSGNNKS